jgi:hypothetical protein
MPQIFDLGNGRMRMQYNLAFRFHIGEQAYWDYNGEQIEVEILGQDKTYHNQ